MFLAFSCRRGIYASPADFCEWKNAYALWAALILMPARAVSLEVSIKDASSMTRVVVAISGGVDSSVAAWLMKRAGYEVHGVFLDHGVERWIHTGETEKRTLNTDVSRNTKFDQYVEFKRDTATGGDAQRVADTLDIPLHTIDMSEPFMEILRDFTQEYLAGRTPNPCVRCNPRIKFRLGLEWADRIGAEFLVTGHYAKLVDREGVPELRRATFTEKDQSYVLHALPREWLPRLQFPLGEIADKETVRQMACEAGIPLPIVTKRESQDICFLPEGDRIAFLERLRRIRCGLTKGLWTKEQEQRIPQTLRSWPEIPAALSGDIVDTSGRKLGTHPGIERFTVGQRKGLRTACGERKYVVTIDASDGRVTLGNMEDLRCGGLIAQEVNWLVPVPAEAFECELKVRYRSRPIAARIEPIAEDETNEWTSQNVVNRVNTDRDGNSGGMTWFRAIFREVTGAIAPGQYAVMYAGDRVLGGGRITRSIKKDTSST